MDKLIYFFSIFVTSLFCFGVSWLYWGSKLNKFMKKDKITNMININEFYQKYYNLIQKEILDNYAFVVLDIDNFSGYNTLYGIDKGNSILNYVGERIIDFLSENEYGSRVISDNFVMLLKKDEVLNYRIDNLILDIKGYKDIKRVLSVSVGIYFLTSSDNNYVECETYAQLAKQNVKNTNSHIGCYDISLNENFFKEQILFNDFEQGLRNKEFLLFYQVKVDILTNNVIGAEALIRWNHQKYGILSPIQFLNIFEKRKCIEKLDIYVVEQACDDILNILENYPNLDDFKIAINISGEGFLNEEVMKKIEQIIFVKSVSPKYIEFELTESFFIDENKRPEVIKKIDYLRKLGFQIAMDDFGSGYSSLNLLKNLNVDTLKIDKGFFDDDTPKAYDIVNSIIQLANNLGIKTVAEGVETEEQQNDLRRLGCLIGQGYLYSKPIPLNIFKNTFLENISSKYKNS